MNRLRGEVVILGKTKMGAHVCVGGFDLVNRRAVRLLSPAGQNPSPKTPFHMNDLWDIEYEPEQNLRVPQTEDVRVTRRKRIGAAPQAIEQVLPHVEVVNVLDAAFENQLNWTVHGSGFVNIDGGVPDHSTCFCVSPSDVAAVGDHESVYYVVREQPLRRLKYVGVAAHAPAIAQGSVLRLSLARWWSPDDADVEERCYLQLSGWFEHETA